MTHWLDVKPFMPGKPLFRGRYSRETVWNEAFISF
jgi:hypothetical protein